MRILTLLLCAALLLVCGSGLKADTADTIPFLTQLKPANEVPAITDTSTGNVIVWVHVIRDSSGNITSGSVDFDVTTKFSGAVTVTGLHIHNAAAGSSGGIVVPTDVNGTDKSIAIDATGKASILKQVQFPQTTPAVTVATITDLLANPQNYYANIHTTDHPSGAMRGQLLRADMKVLMGLMSPQNEVPPAAAAANASGIATATVLRALDSTGNVAFAEVIFNLQYTGFDAASGTTFTGFHIHKEAVGHNGSVIINTGITGTNSVLADASGTGTLFYEVPISPADASFTAEADAVNGLFNDPAGYYINAHTTVFGGGVIRDQLRNTERSVVQVNLLPANEVPPVTGLAANATSQVPIYIVRNADGTVAAGTVIFDVNFRGFPAGTTITGLHIHEAAAGVAGSIVIQSGVAAGANSVSSDSGNGNIYRAVTVSKTADIAALSRIMQNPAGFYVNLHTSVNGSGAIRDQMASAAKAPVAAGTTAVSSAVTSYSAGSALSIYGSNLTAFHSDLTGITPLIYKASPTSVDGVTVTIGGVKAPFYALDPSQLNVQVPFEVAQGTQALVVTTAAGASTPLNIKISSEAPSIFVVDAANKVGTVVKNTGFTLVTATNPVKAGDAIVIYSTGLGQTSPAMLTGVLLQPPAGGFNKTDPVAVSIGGQNAPVIYSIGAPFFVGVYQTAVTVPAGVSGTVSLILSQGSDASNSVNITVQ